MVVGTGSIGNRHLRNLLELGHRDLIAVSEFSKRASLEIDGLSIPVHHNLKSLLEHNKSIKSVFLCNPSSMHYSYLLLCVYHGKHVYLEKPVASSISEITEVESLIRSNPVTIAVGNQFRFDPQLIEIKERIAHNAIGEIHSTHAIQGEHIEDYHPGENFRLGYASRKELGGGVLLTQIHQIDYLNWLLGPFKSVLATYSKPHLLNLDVEENVSYLLCGPKGETVYGHVDYLRRPKIASLVLSGTLGTIEWSYYDRSLKVIGTEPDSSPSVSNINEDRNVLFQRAIKNFFDSIDGKSFPRSTLVDGINALAIVEAIKKSAADQCASKIKTIDELS
ncbi:Gfo/Idh/MocA family protein [Arenicellales bacterium IMCC58067]